ncbi:hypothetical protein LI139_10725, partial [Veillonella atypica]|nr:hypothetical protein [Veillonella atypica]
MPIVRKASLRICDLIKNNYMKAIFISFNQAYYEAIVSIMDRNNLKGFTYWDVVQGRGSKTGEPHYGN